MNTPEGLQIVRVNPLEYEEQIKKLFLDHDRPEFPDFFDRAYPSAVGGGASSWVGLDSGGQVVMHQGRFLKQFRSPAGQARAGLFVNMMVTTNLRSFFPARSLLRRALDDSRADGLDFVYTDPNRIAGALFERNGFAPIGTLRRFVLPLGRDPLGHVVRIYRFLQRLVPPYSSLSAVSQPAAGRPAPSEAEFQSGEDTIVPYRPAALYQQRVQGYPGTGDAWSTVLFRDSEPPLGTCLIRGPDASGEASLVVILHRGAAPLPAILRAVARDADNRGLRGLNAWTIDGSRLARALGQAGFLARADRSTIYGLPFTTLGTELVTSGHRWEITDLDCDRGI